MAMFESAAIAYHDALLLNEGMQDPFAHKVRSTKPGDQGVREAELAKIKKVINALPEDQRLAGHWCFGPSDSEESNNARDKIIQKIWSAVRDKNQRRIKNYFLTVKLQILLQRAVHDARQQACSGERLFSYRQLSIALAISPSSFDESWKADYEQMVSFAKDLALEGLTEVDKEVNKINAKYRRAS